MSGKTIRTGSGAASSATRTDWARVKALRDRQIDAAIADDPDAYPLETEVLGRTGSAYRYEVYKDAKARFRWRLIAADGQVLASSNEDFSSKAEAKNSIAQVRNALLGGQQLAA